MHTVDLSSPKMNFDTHLFCLQFWGEFVNHLPLFVDPTVKALALYRLPLSSAGLCAGWEPEGAVY